MKKSFCQSLCANKKSRYSKKKSGMLVLVFLISFLGGLCAEELELLPDLPRSSSGNELLNGRRWEMVGRKVMLVTQSGNTTTQSSGNTLTFEEKRKELRDGYHVQWELKNGQLVKRAIGEVKQEKLNEKESVYGVDMKASSQARVRRVNFGVKRFESEDYAIPVMKEDKATRPIRK